MSELILGTAQFGDSYGVTNTRGRLSEAEIAGISNLAIRNNIRVFDTAPSYGDAQRRIGSFVNSATNIKIISKFTLSSAVLPTPANVFDATFETLGVDSLYGMLFHRANDLLNPKSQTALEFLREARQSGKIHMIGISVYDAEELILAFQRFSDADVIQVPANALDRELLTHPVLIEFRKRGAVVHARSPYLQGLLLQKPKALSPNLSQLGPSIAELREIAAREQVTLPTLLLSYLKHHPNVDGVIVGATSRDELAGTLDAWQHARAISATLPDAPKSLLDPRTWKESS